MASMQDKIRKLEFSKKYAWHQFFLMKNLVEELSRGIVDIPEHIKNQIIDLAKRQMILWNVQSVLKLYVIKKG
jgi:hypothetical protein